MNNFNDNKNNNLNDWGNNNSINGLNGWDNNDNTYSNLNSWNDTNSNNNQNDNIPVENNYVYRNSKPYNSSAGKHSLQPSWMKKYRPKNKNNRNENNRYNNENYQNSTDSEPIHTIQTKSFKLEIGKPEQKKKRDIREYLDSSDPVGAEVIEVEHKYTNENKSIHKIVALLFVSLLAIYALINRNADKTMIIISIIILSFLGIFLYSSVIALIDTITLPKKRRKRCTQSVTAQIVDVREVYHRGSPTDSSGGHTDYYPVYKYTYAGKIYIDTSAPNRGLDIFGVGNEMDILINPNDPEDYFIESEYDDTNNIFLSIFFIVASIVGVIAFLFAL